MAVAPAIRAVCQFARLNLTDDARAVLIGRVDTIFSRNVLIYLDLETRQKKVRMFCDRLLLEVS